MFSIIMLQILIGIYSIPKWAVISFPEIHNNYVPLPENVPKAVIEMFDIYISGSILISQSYYFVLF